MLWVFLVGLLILVVAMAVALAIALRVAMDWGTELVELQAHGVAGRGRVVEKRQTRRKGATSTWIRYEYVDQFGKSHRSRRNLVTPDAWDAHVEGGPIDIVYSHRRPKISLPKYLLDVKAARPGVQ